MNVQSPRHATRVNPGAAGLDARLVHAGGWPALSITDSPQTVELLVTNRTPHSVNLSSGRLELLIRPGILFDTDKLSLAPQSEADWGLQLSQDSAGDVRLVFQSAAEQTLLAGASLAIRLDGVSIAPEGGSRATRVEVIYGGFHHADAREISGSHLLHVPILRRHLPEHLSLLRARSGASAMAGPFIVGFVSKEAIKKAHQRSHTENLTTAILNDGETANRLTLRLMNLSGRALVLSGGDDSATRVHVSWPLAEGDSPWGLCKREGDHVSIVLGHSPDLDWQLNGYTLRRLLPGVLPPGGYIELDLTIHSRAETGQTPLIVSFENLPEYDDDDMILMPHLGPLAVAADAVTIIKPVNLYGRDARLSFHAADAFQQSATPPSSLSVHRQNGPTQGRLEIRAPRGLTIDADTDINIRAKTGLRVENEATFEGKLTAQKGIASQGSFIHTPSGGRVAVFSINDSPSQTTFNMTVRDGDSYVTGLLINAKGLVDIYRGLAVQNGLTVSGELTANNGIRTSGSLAFLSNYNGEFAFFQAYDALGGTAMHFRVRDRQKGIMNSLSLHEGGNVEVFQHLKVGGEVQVGSKLTLPGDWQIIPTTSRTQLHFKKGDEIVFVIEDNGQFWAP